MLLLKIILGLLGLGIVIFIHELGHFLMARLTGIDVEAFSIGWGNPVLKKKIGGVEYRLGMFPIGGYCKMKGETDYKEAWENLSKGLKPEKGSYLGASPGKRILVSFGGPLFNLLFAIILFSFLWGIGFEINTLGNKIILASEITQDQSYPADEAGFKTGDRIIEINGKKINYYHEAQENIALNPEKPLLVTVDRDNEIITLNVKPSLDKSSGAGKIGIYFWIDPVIESVQDGSLAADAGLMAGDRIVKAQGEPIQNNMDLMKIIEQNPESITLEYERNGVLMKTQMILNEPPGDLGFSWRLIHYRTPNLSAPQAAAAGFREGYKVLSTSIRSLKLLFMGIDLTQAVSGPVRLTYMIGDMAAQGFGQSFGIGIRSVIDFISLVSIALCVMNLLPLPILDGGMIILFLVELIRRKPAHPRAITIFQTCGIVIIFGLMLLAVFGDVLYFVRN